MLPTITAKRVDKVAATRYRTVFLSACIIASLRSGSTGNRLAQTLQSRYGFYGSQMMSSVAFPYRLVSVCSRRRSTVRRHGQKLSGWRRSQIDLEQTSNRYREVTVPTPRQAAHLEIEERDALEQSLFSSDGFGLCLQACICACQGLDGHGSHGLVVDSFTVSFPAVELQISSRVAGRVTTLQSSPNVAVEPPGSSTPLHPKRDRTSSRATISFVFQSCHSTYR